MKAETVHVEGIRHVGTSDFLDKKLSAMGYQEMCDGQSPHAYWQAAEYVKREFKKKDRA